MKNQIQIFNNPEFGEVRTVTIDNEPWFVGNDVAKPLGYAEPKNAVAKYVDDEDKLRHQFDSSGQSREMVIINESGLYSLIFGSKMPKAKEFKRWVTSEVLPAIRRTGSYLLPSTPAQKIQVLLEESHSLRIDVENVKEDISNVKDELKEFKDDLPIFLSEAQIIVDSVKKKGVGVLGGKQSEAYNDRSLRQTVYSDIYSEIYRQFGLTSYKQLKRNQMSQALDVINSYNPPIVLEEKISDTNAQLAFA